MNSYERIYEMILLADPIEEDLKSAAKAASRPVVTARKALVKRLPKTSKIRKGIATGRRKLGHPEWREIVGAALGTAALTAGGLGASAKLPKKPPVPVEQPATTKAPERGKRAVVPKRGDIKPGLGKTRIERVLGK